MSYKSHERNELRHQEIKDHRKDLLKTLENINNNLLLLRKVVRHEGIQNRKLMLMISKGEL